MFKITQKLRSSRGASLILAMVFMLMCLFVGGSVLAAATANGGRVADLTSSQQSYLSQRSAALLMADMLEGDGNSNLQLTIKRVETTEGEESTVEISYSLSGAASPTTLQRILVENALLRYRTGRAVAQEMEKSFEGFSFPSVTPGYSPSTAYLYGSSTGSFSVEEPNGTTLTAGFYSPEPVSANKLSSENFDLTIHFGNDSLLVLYVKATTNINDEKSITVTQNGITTTTTTTVIRWDDPVIEKGGFSS